MLTVVFVAVIIIVNNNLIITITALSSVCSGISISKGSQNLSKWKELNHA